MFSKHFKSIFSKKFKYFLLDKNVRSFSILPSPLLTQNKIIPNDSAKFLKQLTETFNTKEEDGKVIPIHQRSLLYGNNIAIKDNVGEYRYIELYSGAKKFAQQLSLACNGFGTSNKVAFLCTNSSLYILAQWACWIAGQIAVPLNPQHPNNLLEYFINDSEACVLVTVTELEERCVKLAKPLNRLNKIIVVNESYIPTTISPTQQSYVNDQNSDLFIEKNDGTIDINEPLNNEFYSNANAMILYTSGSTGRPKGAIMSHSNLMAQAKCLTSAWYISEKDTLLHCAPLQHALGSIHTLTCPLSVGSRIIMLPKFDVIHVWNTLLNENDKIDIFMAVPTMYKKLIIEYDRTFGHDKKVAHLRQFCQKNIRLMAAGSSPLPQSVYERWYKITGHHILLRYGTTEIGMALSNSYITDNVRKRSGQSVGRPYPGCHVKLVENNQTVIEMSGEYEQGFWSQKDMTSAELNANDTQQLCGEFYVRGKNVFPGYYNRPDATESSFDGDWFKTGDYGKYENGVFSVLGRTNVDIIKSGGHKVSALEIETQLMEHSDIVDVCIVGVPDDVWGQVVGALVVLKDSDKSGQYNFEEIQKWCKDFLAVYQVPRKWISVLELKRNEMGKVNKADVLKEYFITKE